MKDIVAVSSPWIAILVALWMAPDWVLKWIQVRDCLRSGESPAKEPRQSGHRQRS